MQKAAGLKNALQMVRNANNPEALIGQMFQNHPGIRPMMDLVNQHGGDPQQAFYAEAKKRGVDPDTILSLLK